MFHFILPLQVTLSKVRQYCAAQLVHGWSPQQTLWPTSLCDAFWGAREGKISAVCEAQHPNWHCCGFLASTVIHPRT